MRLVLSVAGEAPRAPGMQKLAGIRSMPQQVQLRGNVEQQHIATLKMLMHCHIQYKKPLARLHEWPEDLRREIIQIAIIMQCIIQLDRILEQ